MTDRTLWYRSWKDKAAIIAADLYSLLLVLTALKLLGIL